MNMKKCTKDVKELANEACEGLKAGLSVGVALIPVFIVFAIVRNI